jgi:peptide/nickel transport system substrate-binding protein
MFRKIEIFKIVVVGVWLFVLITWLFSTLTYAQGSGVTITVVRGTDVWTGDPLNDTQATSQSVFQNVFDPLVRVNWDNPGDPLPALAVSWKFLSPTAIQFNLRKGVKWHDGRDFTAEDVKFTFDRVLSKDKPTKVTSWVISIVKSVSISDDYTVVLETYRPYAPIFPRLDVVKIIPKETFTTMGAEAFGQKPVGTGAYIFDEWAKGQYIRLKANESWWGWVDREKRPDVVIRKSIPEGFTRYAMLKSGEADIVGQIAPERIPEIKATKGLNVVTTPSLRGFFVGMNTRRPPFDNVKVRQAMNYGVNPQLIVDTILGGQATVHTGVCSVHDFGYCKDCKPYDYDPARAKKLLAEAGYPNGFKVKFWSPRGKYMKDLESSEAIAGQLEEIGLQVEVYAPAWPEYWDNFLAGKLEMYFLSYGAAFPDCDDRIGGHLDKARRGIYYSSPFSDELIKKEQETVDPVKRHAIFDQLSKYFLEQAPWIFLWDQNLIYGLSSKIKEWKPLPVEHIFYWKVRVK